MSKKLELQKKMGLLVTEQRALIDSLVVDEITTEQESKIKRMDEDLTTLERQIELVSKAEERKLQEAIETDTPAAFSGKEAEIRSLIHYAKTGKIGEEYRGVLKAFSDSESRAQGTLTAGSGGVLVPTELQNVIIKTLKAFGGIYEISSIFNTSGGNPLVYPNMDNTANKAVIVGQAANVGTATDLVFGSKTFGSYKYSTGVLKVNQEIISDSSFNIESEVIVALAERMARGLAEHFISGNGSTQPEGIVTALLGLGADGIGVTAGASAITADNLIDLQHSINSAYRNSSSKYVFSDTTLAALRKLKTSTGEYIWAYPDIQKGIPGTLLGRGYQICDDLASIGTGNMSVLFGDFANYKIRNIGSPVLKRTDELFMETDQVGFLMLQRIDAKFMLSGTIKGLKHA